MPFGATAAAASEVGGGAKRGVVALFETWAKDGTVAGLKAGWAEVSKGIEGASRVGDLMREDAERGTNAYVEFRNAILGARQAAAGAMVGPPDLRASSGPGIGALSPPGKPAKFVRPVEYVYGMPIEGPMPMVQPLAPKPERLPLGLVKPMITNSWRSRHLSLIQSGVRRAT